MSDFDLGRVSQAADNRFTVGAHLAKMPEFLLGHRMDSDEECSLKQDMMEDTSDDDDYLDKDTENEEYIAHCNMIDSLEYIMETDIECTAIIPEKLKENESKLSMSMSSLELEKMMLEQVLLRKDMRLRSIQQKVLTLSKRLEKSEGKLNEYEEMVLFREFLVLSRWLRKAVEYNRERAHRMWMGAMWITQAVLQVGRLLLYRAPFALGYDLPVAVAAAAPVLAARLANIIARKAENMSNTYVENMDKVERKGRRRDARRRRK